MCKNVSVQMQHSEAVLQPAVHEVAGDKYIIRKVTQSLSFPCYFHISYVLFHFLRFFIFIMEDWISFNNKEQKFKFAWLLKNRTTTSSKTVRLKPWRVPDVNCDVSQNFKYFLVNFNYPNYRVHEFMSSHF